jgi:hypothetical protein
MKKILLLLIISLTSTVCSQAQKRNGIKLVEPLTLIDTVETKFAALGWVNNFFTAKRYAYYRTDEQGVLFYNGGYVGSRNTDSALVAIPSGWTNYLAPLTEQQLIAIWNPNPTESYEMRARSLGSNGWYLTQTVSTSPDIYAVRAWSMLDSNSVVIITNTDNYDNLLGLVSSVHGLAEPANVPIPSGYTRYQSAEGTWLYTEGTPQSQLSEIFVSYTPTSVDNSINLSQFPDVTVPSKLNFVFGHGSPMFTEMLNTTPAIQLRKGWTHTSNGSVAGVSKIPASATSKFQVPTQRIIDRLDAINTNYKYDFGLFSTQEAYNIGFDIAINTGSMIDPETNTFSKPVAHYLFDEEEINDAINQYHFKMGYIMKGVSAGLTAENLLVFYGRATSYNLAGGAYAESYPFGYSQAFIDQLPNDYFAYAQAYAEANTFLDISGGYFRTPIPPTQTYYQKSGGQYVLNAGKRVFRTDAFTDTIWGKTVNFLNAPDALFLQYSNAAGSSVYQNPSLYRNDAYWAIHNQYRMHDKVQLNSIMLNKAFTGQTDISYWQEHGTKPWAVVRPFTENYTFGGNSSEVRPLDDAALRFMVYSTVMQGVRGMETWEAGTGGETQLSAAGSGQTYTIEPDGTRLYVNDETFAPYEAYTSAVQGVIKAYEGRSFNNTLKYFHFSKYVESYQNKEILGGGIYQGDKLHLWLCYPYHDPTDTTSIVFELGNELYNINLIGRSPKLYEFTYSGEVNNSNLKIRYNNIDNQEIYVTGDIWNRSGGAVTPPVSGTIPTDQYTEKAKFGYLYGGLSYADWASQLTRGVAIYNYYGSPNQTYPAQQNCGQSSCNYQTYNDSLVVIQLPTHSINYANTDAIGVWYKFFDANNNLVHEVYDTRSGHVINGVNVRGNNHPDDASRWIKRGVYRVEVTNLEISTRPLTFRVGTTEDSQENGYPNQDSIIGQINIEPGQTVVRTLDLSQPCCGTVWHSFKMNINAY